MRLLVVLHGLRPPEQVRNRFIQLQTWQETHMGDARAISPYPPVYRLWIWTKKRYASRETIGRMKRALVPALIAIVTLIAASLLLRDGRLNADVRKVQVTVGNTTRHCRIVVPHKHRQPMPVVFAFHGTGDSTDSMADYSRLDRMAANHGFLLAYPAASNSMWSTMNVELSELNTNRDIQFFDELLDHLSSVYQIDRDRVYVMGMSNGATFAQLLAVARPSEVAAVVAHSGSLPTGFDGCNPSVPVMLIVGANDLEWETMKANADQYRRSGCAVEYISIPQLAHAWSTRHNLTMWQFLSRHARHRHDKAEQSDAPKPPNGAF